MIITRTPFRISFFGGGTDYPAWYREHGGAVLSTSINKYCYITVRHLAPIFPYKYRIRYTHQEEAMSLAEIQHTSVRECMKFLNFFDTSIEMQHNADLPAMIGLGSSSSFTVGFLHALYTMGGKKVSKQQLAEEAIHVEQEYCREHVGSQDQTIAASGGLNKIEFSKDGSIHVAPLSIIREKANRLADHCMLIYTGQSRVASEIAAEQIKNTPAKNNELDLMRQMVDEAMSILASKQDRFQDFGTLLHESWQIKRTLSSKITNPLIDAMYEEALKVGAYGGKLLGAGGGGFLLLFVPPELQRRVREHFEKSIFIPFAFEQEGTQVVYQAADESGNIPPATIV